MSNEQGWFVFVVVVVVESQGESKPNGMWISITQTSHTEQKKQSREERTCRTGENTYKVSFCKTVWDARRTQEQ